MTLVVIVVVMVVFGVDILHAVLLFGVCVVVLAVVILVRRLAVGGGRVGPARPLLRPAPPGQPLGARVGGGFLLRLGQGLLLDERLTVGHRDLIIIGMDFVEGEEAVTVAAVVDEGRLQRRLDARHLRQIDVAAEKFARRALVVELLYASVTQHHHPGLLGMGGVDEHLVGCHVFLSSARRWAGPPEPALRPEATCGRVEARAFGVCEGKKVGVNGRARIPGPAAAGSVTKNRNARSICMVSNE